MIKGYQVSFSVKTTQHQNFNCDLFQLRSCAVMAYKCLKLSWLNIAEFKYLDGHSFYLNHKQFKINIYFFFKQNHIQSFHSVITGQARKTSDNKINNWF